MAVFPGGVQILKQVPVNAESQAFDIYTYSVTVHGVYLALLEFHRPILLISATLLHAIVRHMTAVNNCHHAPQITPTSAKMPSSPKNIATTASITINSSFVLISP
jgi:hypothetical protein